MQHKVLVPHRSHRRPGTSPQSSNIHWCIILPSFKNDLVPKVISWISTLKFRQRLPGCFLRRTPRPLSQNLLNQLPITQYNPRPINSYRLFNWPPVFNLLRQTRYFLSVFTQKLFENRNMKHWMDLTIRR